MFTTITSFIMAVLMVFNIMSGNAFDGDTKFDELAGNFVEQQGVLGYLYNDEGNYFYTATDAWQGVLGFNDLYDRAAPLVVMYYDTQVFNFNYDHKDWRIQLWKGQYGWVFIGAEVGVYTKRELMPLEHYRAADEGDRLGISFKLTRFGFWELFETEYKNCWWCTGFVPGSLVLMNWYSQLRMDVRITMKDTTMLKAFTDSIRDAGYSYTTDGLDVYLAY